MKIEKVQLHYVEGAVPAGVATMSSKRRHAEPADYIDGYERTFDHLKSVLPKVDDNGNKTVKQCFLEIITNTGLIGTFGPIKRPQVISRVLNYARIIVGMDPLATERIWEVLIRTTMNGYSGTDMEAASAVDIALWDLKGKVAGLPLYQLLGGKVRESVPAYCNCSGFPADDINKSIAQVKEKGYKAMKWPTPYGPKDGEAGKVKMVNFVRKLREEAGDDLRIMIDCCCAWTLDYAKDIIPKLEPYDISWIEEPLIPLQFDAYAELKKTSPVMIATGEHFYTRWMFKQALDKDIADIYQPDPGWIGLSETMKVLTLINSYDRLAALHGASPSLAAHIALSTPSYYMLDFEIMELMFGASRVLTKGDFVLENGMVIPSDNVGIGVEIDQAKVIREWFE